MKKIVYVIARLNIGGPAVYLAHLAGMVELGYELTIIHGRPSEFEGDMAYLFDNRRVKRILVPDLGREISFAKDLLTILKLCRLLRSEMPDIVHTHTAKGGFLGRTAARIVGVKGIYHTFHGHVFHSYFGSLKTKVFVLIEKMLSMITSRIIVLNNQQRDEIATITGIGRRKFAVIPLGLDLADYSKSRFGLTGDSGEIRIAIVGRLTGVKNHRLCFEALKTMMDRGINFRASVVGDGELRAEMEHLCIELGLKDKVKFSGWVRDVAMVYSEIEYLFLTSKNEGTPVAIIEAMAAGRIVISTAVGGVPDLIRDGENGFLVENQDPVAFADKFMQVHALPESRKQTIRAAARETAKGFSVEALLENMHRLYSEGAGT